MSNVNTLIAQRAGVWGQMQALEDRALAEGRTLSAEEREQWDRMEADLEGRDADIARFERKAQRSAGGAEPDEDTRDTETGGVTHRSAFESFLRNGAGGMTGEEREFLLKVSSKTRESMPSVVRAQLAGTNNLGGYAVAPEFWSRLSETMKDFGGLIGEVNVVNTGTGAPMQWPTLNATALKATIVGEGDSNTLTNLTFGTRTLSAYTYRAAAGVSIEGVQDIDFDIEALIVRQLGMMFGRGLAEHIAVGDGAGKPQGIGYAATTGKTGAAGQVTSIILDDLYDLEHSIDTAYRKNAKYALNDLSVKMIRKLKDADNKPVWQPSLQLGVPSTINARGYIVDNDLPVPAASAKSILFGDFKSAYVLRSVLNPLILRTQERYIDQGIVAYFGFARYDGRIDDPSAVRAYAHPAA